MRRLLITNDLHQRQGKWKALVDAVAHESPAFVLIAGDILIWDKQPLLGCSGHIHESPHQMER